ncbi:MAG TPA: NAD(P)-dependent alcohol dehydrogenase [Steroidobacteraceae bacterium]|nr:NAD(P)-dependent alcohol dehydrogenase [Steroidobacteraceae bacterium]
MSHGTRRFSWKCVLARTGAAVVSAATLTALIVVASLTIASRVEAKPIPSTQKQYRLVRTGKQGPLSLQLVDAPVHQPGPHEVLVKVHAASLNRHDIFTIKEGFGLGSRESVVPLSDGAGEVVAIGSGVTRFRVGDRVAGIFFQRWLSGRARAEFLSSVLGGEQFDGMLTQYATLNEQGLVKLPPSLSYEEGSTLPCAGVTAWNGLFTQGHLQRGDTVLLEGTGGVSSFGLVFAVAAGAKVIITSSHDEKLERAKALGAFGTINYKKTPDWEKPVRQLTGGRGVDQILEVGGKDTVPHALKSLAVGGHIALIGGLGGFGGDIPVTALLSTGSTASGIYVGSRADFEAMNAFIERHHVKPVVDRVIPFSDAKTAYELMEADQFFGKIVISMDR